MKQKPIAVGITKVGRGQSFRLAREMKELLSRNIPAQSEFDSKSGVDDWDHHPPDAKPLVCQCVFVDKPAGSSEGSSQTDQKPPNLIAAKRHKRHIKRNGATISFYVPFVPFAAINLRRSVRQQLFELLKLIFERLLHPWLGRFLDGFVL